MKPSYAGVVFDVYGTLLDVASIGAEAERLRPGQGAKIAALWREKQIDGTRLRTLAGRFADFWSVTADALGFVDEALRLGLGGAETESLLARYAVLCAHPDALPALKALRAKGLRLGVLSNAGAPMLRRALDAAALTPLLDHVLSAESVKKFKVAPEAYAIGPEAFGAPAQALLFVSSNAWDVAGAAWFGYDTFWVNRSGAPFERLGVQPTAAGPSLAELAAAL